jgi:hypothetical protein
MADAVSKPAALLEVSMDRCPASSMDVKKQQLPPPLAVVVDVDVDAELFPPSSGVARKKTSWGGIYRQTKPK